MAEPRVLEGGSGVGTLLRAALPSIPLVNQLPGVRKTGGDVGGLAFTRQAVPIERAHAEAYAEVCRFPRKDTVPLPYPHVLAAPLHLAILTDPAFPYPAIGTVHLANTITSYRPLGIGEVVSATTRADALRPHPKGRVVDLVTTVEVDGEVVWDSTSTYLHRGRGDQDAVADSGPVEIPDAGTEWRLAGDLGRRYAAVSGDHNPIHLYPLTAKALGFPRQIAHGMWSLARCVAALENRLPGAVTVDVAFKKPIFLPGTVGFGIVTHDDGLSFAMTSPKDGSPHVIGRTQGT